MRKFLAAILISLSFSCSVPNIPVVETTITKEVDYSPYQVSTLTIMTADEHSVYAGTGFIFGQKDNEYLVLTARHVIIGPNGHPSEIIIGIPTLSKDNIISRGLATPLSVIKISPANLDLAILGIPKVNFPTPISPLHFYSGPPINSGSNIFSVGSPGNTEGVLSPGQISKYTNDKDLLYLIANNMGMPGSSGSGLIYNGQVIGIIQKAYSVNLNKSLSSHEIIKWLKEEKIEYKSDIK